MENEKNSSPNTEEQEKEIIMPKWELNKKIIIIGLCVGIVLLLAVIQVAGKALNKAKSPDKQEKVINDTMLEAQQQMGDEFYNAASNGAPIPEGQEGAQATDAQAQQSELGNVNPSMASQNVAAAQPNEKLVTINLAANVGRVDPFVPTVNYGSRTANGLPSLPSVNYPAPPTTLITNEPAIKLMETTISGIMYDAISPSAIVKVEGQDHLVRKGDRINGYKILNITKDRVVVQNGTNVYRATVGETLTATQNAVTFNTVDNLPRKFGGASAPKGTRMIQIN